MDRIKQSIDILEKYIVSENFKGYDPYDTLNSFLPFGVIGKWGNILAIQFQKRNPINIRPLLGIKKFYSTKGMGLLLQAYINLYQSTKDEKYIRSIEYIKDWLLNNHQFFKNTKCWGYDYSYATPQGVLKKGYPTVIHHSYIQRALFSYYNVFKDQRIKDFLLESKDFVLNALQIKHFNKGICFSYNPKSTSCVYNASMHAAECLARVYAFTKEDELRDLCIQVLDYVVSRQRPDGVWYYSFVDEEGDERKQVDFHQGFILDSFDEVSKHINYFKKAWELAVERGLKYYYNEQFKENGAGIWRVPNEFPVDVHNQAQGILTFSRFATFDEKYGPFAKKIADWTIQNMQNKKKGFFYYRKYKSYTNKISYMRWSQAWMLLALSELLIKSYEND
jgi:hypothetical protein